MISAIRLNLHIRQDVQSCLHAELLPLQGRHRSQRLQHLAALGLLHEKGHRALPTNNEGAINDTDALTAEDVSLALGNMGGRSDV